MLAFVAKQSEEFNQIQISVSLAAGFPLQLLEAYRYATAQTASFQFYVNQTYLNQFVAIDKIRLNEHLHSDASLLLNDGQITLQESHGTFVLFTLRAGIVLPYSARVKSGQYQIKLRDLVPVYLVNVLRPSAELQLEFSLPQILYKNRQSDVMSVPANQMKLQALGADVSRLREAQATIWRDAERVEQQLYKEFKQNVLRVQQVAQFGVNAIQTEVQKNEAHMSRVTRLLKAVEDATQGVQTGPTVQQLKILSGQQTSRTQSTLFDISRQTLLQAEQFHSLVEGKTQVADRITPELQVQFKQQLPTLEQDARLFMDRQLQHEQLAQNIKETRRVQDVLQSSVSLQKTLEKHNPELIQSAAQYLPVSQIRPSYSQTRQPANQMDLFDHQQMYAPEVVEPTVFQDAPSPQFNHVPQNLVVEPQYERPYETKNSTVQRQIPVNLAGSAIERKAATINKRFPMRFDFVGLGEALKDVPVASLELQLPAFLNLLSYHFCKFKQLETVRPVSLNRRQSFVNTQQLAFFWNRTLEKLVSVLSVLTPDGRAVQSSYYDLVEGIFLQNDQTSLRSAEIQTKDFTLTDRMATPPGGQPWPVEGMAVFEVE